MTFKLKHISIIRSPFCSKEVDILDGTPLLDIKPYIENFDKVESEVRLGWIKPTQNEVTKKRSDDRFIEKKDD